MDKPSFSLKQLSDAVAKRQGADPKTSYVAQLLHKGQNHILKKIAEESTELVMASKDGQQPHIVAECADVWFHTLVLLAHHGLTADDVLQELARREGVSGLDEKAART